MNGILKSCVGTTLLAILTLSTAQSADTSQVFDSAAPNIIDNLPPEDIDKAKTLTANQPTSEVVKKPELEKQFTPFNSKRIDTMLLIETQPKSVTIDGQSVKLRNPNRVASFYKDHNYPTIWTQGNTVNELVTSLKSGILDSEKDALNPQKYHQAIINYLVAEKQYQDIAALEILMTDAYLSLAGDLANGLVNPHIVSSTWDAPKVSDEDLGNLLVHAYLNKDIATSLDDINRQDSYYQMLRSAYNDEITTQISKLDIAINMDRLRWMPQQWGETYIIVNIPAYQVNMIRDGKSIYETRAIVGKPSRPTLQFTNMLRYVVLAPTWTVPPTIMKKDELPKLRANAAAYDERFQAVTADGKTVSPSQVNWNSSAANAYMLRQKPGPHNALGRVKFLFPNDHAIYLHDTPHRNAFQYKNRALSSGCIRLNKPLELANILLENTSWTPEKIKAQSQADTSKWITPEVQTPIYLVYWSVWADTYGKLHRTGDVYKLDAQLRDAYKKALLQ